MKNKFAPPILPEWFDNARVGNIKGIMSAVRRGIDVDLRDCSWYSHGCSAAHYAAQWGQLGVLQHLIEHGADVDQCNECGETPMHLSVGSLDILKCLLDAGADYTVMDNNGDTALDRAMSGHYLDVVNYLKSNGYRRVRMVVFSPSLHPESSSITMEMSCATPGAVIRYTTDGTTPTKASPKYLKPFLWKTPGLTIFKAVAFGSAKWWNFNTKLVASKDSEIIIHI